MKIQAQDIAQSMNAIMNSSEHKSIFKTASKKDKDKDDEDKKDDDKEDKKEDKDKEKKKSAMLGLMVDSLSKISADLDKFGFEKSSAQALQVISQIISEAEYGCEDTAMDNDGSFDLDQLVEGVDGDLQEELSPEDVALLKELSL